ncbi:DUF5658 family protein [uncultured Methanolobus sp.]|uniref:DUF5658 family protein n=1 Tax=uncultured Methanolobus sp. TaxID=218300 RepID=UPI003749970F
MSFIKDIKLLFLLFVVGDTVTTIYALQTELFYEGNPVLSHIFQVFGYSILFVLKLFFIPILYFVYKKVYCTYWNITRHLVTSIGLMATLSNLAALRVLI